MDDLISRRTACDEIGKMIHEYREKDDHDLADALILTRRYVLKRLPAVDAVPVVHAYWVEEPDHSYHWHCSKCKQVWGMTKYFMKYCPNCGAKMDGET